VLVDITGHRRAALRRAIPETTTENRLPRGIYLPLPAYRAASLALRYASGDDDCGRRVIDQSWRTVTHVKRGGCVAGGDDALRAHHCRGLRAAPPRFPLKHTFRVARFFLRQEERAGLGMRLPAQDGTLTC